MPSGAGTEHLVQPGEQGWLVEWLFDEVHTVVEDSLGAEQALGVARPEEHPDAGPVGPALVGELLALHMWHDDVGEQRVDRALVVTQELQRLTAVGGRPQLMA